MLNLRSASVTLLAASYCFVAAAPSPVGTWSGRIVINPSKTMTADEKKQYDAVKVSIAKLKMTLIVSGNHSFVAKVTGGPAPSKDQSGKWNISGNVVTLSVPGQPGDQKFTLAGNGKKMTHALPSGKGITAAIVFSR